MIKILVADDHPIVRNGLKKIISDESDMEVTSEAADAKQVFEMVHKNNFDVVVLDVSMPGLSGFDILAQLKIVYPSLTVLMLSALSEDIYAKMALKSGASGFINKESASEELVKAIRKVYSGGLYVSQFIAEKFANEFKNNSLSQPHEMLSNREMQVMRLIASGKQVSEIAKILFLSVKTVSTYRARVLEKMNIKNNAELTNYCFKMGLTV